MAPGKSAGTGLGVLAGGRGLYERAGVGKAESATALMGDPFCEPQGLNSVFDTDKSTLAVVAKANEKLMALAK